MLGGTPTKRPQSGYETSPGRQKIADLSEKLNNLDRNEENTNSRRAAFDQRLKNIDDKLKRAYQNEDATFRLFKEQFIKLQEAMSSQKTVRENQEDKKNKELKTLDTNITLDITVERQERKESEREVLQILITHTWGLIEI